MRLSAFVAIGYTFCVTRPLSLALILGTLILTSFTAWGQSPASPKLIKLFPPLYPPLALQARIQGLVRVQLQVWADGSVESAALAEGHPMLKQAALDSARKSIFECLDCRQGVHHISLVYLFQIRDGCHFGPHCEPLDADQPIITESLGQVTISAAPLCLCDPSATLVRFRSVKCLYLWKCGRREVPDD